MRFIAAVIITLVCVTSNYATDVKHIRVMTFNIRYGSAKDGPDAWPLRKETVAKVFREVKADFVGSQEALVYQIEYLDEQLPDYQVVYRTREVDPKAGEACPIFYLSDRWELDPRENGTFWLSDTPQVPGSITWGARLPRVVTWGRFIPRNPRNRGDDGRGDQGSVRGVYVFNTHYDHQSQPSREKSSELLLKRIAERRHQDEPVIVMGDFNADESNPASVRLRQGPPPLVDTFRVVHPEAKVVGTFGGFKGRRDGGKIDHIYVLPGAEVKSAQILHEQVDGRWPSDHYPVTAVIRF